MYLNGVKNVSMIEWMKFSHMTSKQSNLIKFLAVVWGPYGSKWNIQEPIYISIVSVKWRL